VKICIHAKHVFSVLDESSAQRIFADTDPELELHLFENVLVLVFERVQYGTWGERFVFRIEFRR
jgi:hypothetical protein